MPWLLLFLSAVSLPGAPGFAKRTEMIPMRDGIKLHTEIYTPEGAARPLPLLLQRTPYGLPHDKDGLNPQLTGAMAELAGDGYIFVFQDIRGKYLSEGEFVMIRPPRTDPKGVDESTDCADTIEWLLKNAAGHNGRVGMLGVSYLGWTTVMAALDPHPALKATAPMAPPDDMYLGDDFHHNGAFRLQYGFEYVARLETAKDNRPFDFGRRDTFDWYLKAGSLANIARDWFGKRYPTWNDFVAHPDFDAFWKARKVSPYARQVKVPMLHVAGWWDQEDFYGPMTIYKAFEPHDSRGLNFLVVGPWNHGGWMRGDGDSLGPVRFGSKTAEYFRAQVLAPWFRYWLKDEGKLELPEALTFRTGSNTWQRYNSWPPRDSAAKALFLQAGGVASFEQPGEAAGSDAFLSDPAHPVPYRVRPILPVYGEGSTWGQWLTDDQRHLHGRPDVASWESAPLEEDLTLSGQVTARLFVSTTGSDADWVVKLIDVYSETHEEKTMRGYQLMVANDVFRGRYRNSFEKPEPMKPNQVTPISVNLHTQDYTFRKGHRLMVQIHSTWFPLIDRNPQKYIPNIFQAKESDFQTATHRVYREARYPSRLELQVR